MQIGVISFINTFYFEPQIILINEFIDELGLNDPQLVTISTCHRHEIYFSSEQLESKKEAIIELLKEKLNLQTLPYHYYEKASCFEHLAKLMAGLLSPIIGETHVLNQVKKGYDRRVLNRSLSADMHYLFQKSLKIAKMFRFDHEKILGKERLENLVLEKILKCVDFVDPILLVGNSEINRSILHELIAAGYQKIYLISKSWPSSIEKKITANLSYENLDLWTSYKAIVLATDSRQMVLKSHKGLVETKLIIDLCIPKVTQGNDFLGIEYFDLEQMTLLIQNRQAYLQNWKEKEEKKILSQVERQIVLFYLRQLKKEQLLRR